MHKSVFKILTFSIALWVTISHCEATVVEQRKLKTHLRWSLKSPKSQLAIRKKRNKIYIQTLNEELYQKIVSDLAKLDKNPNYFKKINYSMDNYPREAAQIEIVLKDQSVELFSFFKDRDQQHVLDFWINKDLVQTKKASPVKVSATVKTVKPVIKSVKKAVKRSKRISKIAPSKKIFNIVDPEKVVSSKLNKAYRDFRYGAAFIWDYEPIIPPIRKDVRTASKGPSYLYKIEDVKNLNDPRSAHMQLSINFFRKKQWGLMNKSIELYFKKYSTRSSGNYAFYRDLNDFMKASALIQNSIKENIKAMAKNPEDGKQTELTYSKADKIFAGLNILANLTERTSNYDLKQAALRYRLQYAINKRDFVKALNLSKKLYVASTESFDDDMITYSSEVILHSLAQLNQLDKIGEFLANKAVVRLIPAQVGAAYISYLNVKRGKLSEVTESFAKNKKSYVKPIHPSILYNTAEAYFREANYEKAVSLFDEFLVSYSGFDVSSNAKLRIALSYDLLDRPIKKVLNLYENAINRAANAKIRYEAKIRYVGVSIARKRKVSQRDLETIAFLEKSQDEKKIRNKNIRKLLWLVRLRTFIAQNKFEDAISYLSTIPLGSFLATEKRTFEGDGAEIVVGLIKDLYLNQNYARCVKIWEVYKEKYERKVAKSPYLSFMVADSYLKLGLNDSYKRYIRRLSLMDNNEVRTFPRWVEKHKSMNIKDYVQELKILAFTKNKEWEKADDLLESFSKQDKKNVNYNFYKGLVAYGLKKYNKVVTSFEKTLVTPNKNNTLSPAQTSLMLTNYVESLYQVDNHPKFRKSSEALLKDLASRKGFDYKNVDERVNYLLVESWVSDKKVNYLEVQKLTKRFLNKYPSSKYKNRISYLQGVALINVNQVKAGKEVLEKLLGDKETPEYIKGLARSELSSLRINNPTL